MPDKMLRFSHSARLALSLAQDQSGYFQHPTIGVDHLLLGLLVEAGGIGGMSNTPEGKATIAAFVDAYNGMVRALRNYEAQNVKGGLGTGGTLKVN